MTLSRPYDNLDKQAIMKKIIILLVVIVAAIFLVRSAFQGLFYRTVTKEGLVAVVKCVKSYEKKYDFYLLYFPAPKDGRQSYTTFKFFKLKGVDWMFEGEIIKWKRSLNSVGILTAQRPLRIYDSSDNSYPLESRFQKIAFRIGKLLPFVDTSFISAVRQPYIPHVKLGIYATNSGYLIRRIK